MSLLAAILLAASPPGAAEDLVWALDRGEVALDADRHVPALFAFLQQAEETHAAWAGAQLHLARGLVAQGYRAAGAAWLARVARERLEPDRVARALEDLRALEQGPHDEALAESVFGTLDVAALSPAVAAHAHRVQGTLDLKAGRDAWAKAHFDALPQGSADQARARFAVLVTRLRRGEPVAKVLGAFDALARDAAAPSDVRLEAQLAVARLRYEAKDYPGALQAWEGLALPELSPGRAAVYVEEAWAQYRMGRPNEVLGRLQALDAPAFQQLFLPDKHLLRALVYLESCHYLPARRAARELVRGYASSLQAIRERRPLDQDPMLRRAALGRPLPQRAQAWVDALQAEADRLLKERDLLPGALRAHLEDFYAQALGEAVRVRDERLQASLRTLAAQLLEAAEQVRLVEYEVGLALHARLKEGASAPVPQAEGALSPEAVAYTFSGEYWNDELRDIRFDLKDRCAEARR